MTKTLEPTEEFVHVPANGNLRFIRWKLSLGDESQLTFVVPSNLALDLTPDPPEENDDGSIL